jgi:hypothetical protein
MTKNAVPYYPGDKDRHNKKRPLRVWKAGYGYEREIQDSGAYEQAMNRRCRLVSRSAIS